MHPSILKLAEILRNSLDAVEIAVAVASNNLTDTLPHLISILNSGKMGVLSFFIGLALLYFLRRFGECGDR